MTIQEPAWLKRTRPCPFFSQGRCLFADSCNFLHDVKVRTAVELRSSVQVKQSPVTKPVFDPPSVVVNSASPRSTNLASPESLTSPIHDPSRYSGLLSVLSDVIGPIPGASVSDDPTSQPSAPSFNRKSYPQTTTLDRSHTTDSCFASDSSVTRFAFPTIATDSETDWNIPPHARSSVLQPAGEAFPDVTLLPQDETHVLEDEGETVTEFTPVSEHDETHPVTSVSYLVDDPGPYVIGSDDEEDDDEDVDDRLGEDPAMIVSNRHSILSSFTGASLLASPPSNVFGEPSIASPIDDGASDLLSPVHMSAKLRPFPIPSFDPKVKRGDSIDSGYADSWTGPLPFPRTPPRSFRSSIGFFPSHSRRTSFVSPTIQDRRVSYDVRAVRPCPHDTIEAIEEGESDESSEDNEDTAYTILGAYASSPEGQAENEVHDTLCVDAPAVAEQYIAESDKLSVPPVSRHSRQCSAEHFHSPTYDLEACSQPSFVSDDKESFVTAFSTQPSFDNLSDASTRVSPVKQDSLLSYISGTSTPNTSLLSHDGDSHELFDRRTADSPLEKSSDFAPVTNAAEQTSNPEVSQGRASVVSSPTQDVSAESCPMENTRYPQEFLPQRNAARKRWSSIQILRSSPLVGGAPGHAVADSRDEDTRGLRPTTPAVTVSRELTLGPSPSSAGSNPSSPVDDTRVLLSDGHSVELRVPAQSIFRPSPAGDTHRFAAPGAAGEDPDSHLSDARSSAVLSDSASFDGEGVMTVAPGDGEEDSVFSEFSPSVAYAGLADNPRVLEDQTLSADDSYPSEGLAGSSNSDSNSFSQSHRLTFPLPPPFLPADFVEHSTLPFEEEASISSVGGSVDVEEDATKDASALATETPVEEVQRIRSGSDLTERAGPSQVQAVRSRDSNTDFSLRRSRATSDITVKAQSPLMTLPKDASPTPGALSVPDEHPPRSDSVQSLYDRYFDDNTSDGGDGDIQSSSPVRRNFEAPDFSGGAEIHPSEPSLHSPASCRPVFSPESASSFDVNTTNSGADSPSSEPVFRPLLTGRRSLLNSSLVGLIPKADTADAKDFSLLPTPPSNRLQIREAGSTMVPLGFRRFKPKPAAQRSLRSASQPLQSVLPVAELREVLRIRTDIEESDVPPGCSSAGYASSNLSPLPEQSLSAPPTGGLKPLRLSTIINNNKRSSILSSHSSSIASSIVSLDHISHSSPLHSPTVSSVTSLSRNSLLSSSFPPIPEHTQHTLALSDCNSPVLQTPDHPDSAYSLSTRRDSRSVSAPLQHPKHWRLSHYRAGSRNFTSADTSRRLSRRTSTLSLSYVAEQELADDDDPTISCPIQSASAADWMRPASALSAPVHAIATPKPTLLFAIASDDVEQVRQVLESGEAGPNDAVGPQSALAFTLTNDKLVHKQEIVKALLAYGANPSALRNPSTNPSRLEGGDEPSGPPPETTLEGMDPATRYFVARADAAHTRQTSQLIYRSFFRPLTRVRYDVIGQDWALEQLFRVLSMHSQKLAVAPIVVLLCGPSGHGKSLLARKFGFLLDVPTHTVNMTTLRSTHDIWQSYSMSPYEEPSSCTLAEFLVENEGKRCVVVLDEIEKVEDQKALWSLLMPWELGRCSLEAGKRHVDARNVIWLGTSNVGHELVFEHHQNRAEPEKQMTRKEYLELTEMLRPRVSHHLGASLVSRVTTVLPFVPFTLDERKAIAAEAVYALAGDAAREFSPQDVESLVMKALPSYHPSEGARSLHRAVSNLLVDGI